MTPEEEAYRAGFKDALDLMVEAIEMSRGILSRLNPRHWGWALTGYQEGLTAAKKAVRKLKVRDS